MATGSGRSNRFFLQTFEARLLTCAAQESHDLWTGALIMITVAWCGSSTMLSREPVSKMLSLFPDSFLLLRVLVAILMISIVVVLVAQERPIAVVVINRC